MKIFAFALVATFIGVQVFALTADDIIKNVEACNKKTGVKKEVVDDVLENGIVADDPLLKKDMVCFFQAIEVMDKDGNLDQGKLLEYFKVGRTDEQAQELVEKCGKKKGSPEDTATDIVKCEIKYDKEHEM